VVQSLGQQNRVLLHETFSELDGLVI